MNAPTDSGTFVMVDPEKVAQVGAAAAVLFGRIAWRSERAGSWAASRAVLSQETGLTAYQIRAAVKVLRDAGWVTTARVSADDATLVWTPVYAGQADMVDIATCGTTDVADIAISRWRISPSPDVADIAISSLETVRPTTPLTGGEDSDLFGTPVDTSPGTPTDPLAGFDEWWALYPRKVAKGDARKAWVKITRTTPAAVIHAGLVKHARALGEEHRRGYCPHPATWLRAERWSDQEETNVHPLVPRNPTAGGAYDPEYERSLPPVRKDPFGRGVI